MDDSTVTGAQQVPSGNPKEQETGGNAEDDISDIIYGIDKTTQRRILNRSSEGKNIKQIAEDIGCSLDQARRAVKERQKSLLRGNRP